MRVDADATFETDPTDPDTDGDGYWDGWIGVYDVGRTDNVVLYMENLNSATGMESDEHVDEQAGVHDVTDAPGGVGTQLYDNDSVYHSNIHIGELQWEADPQDSDDVPSPSLTIEVDYYEHTSIASLNSASWATGIERNYALYGIDVTILRDDVLTDGDFIPCIPQYINPGCVDPENGFGYREISATAAQHKTTSADEYVIVANRASGAVPNAETQSGVNLVGVPYMALFVEGSQDDTDNIPRDELQRSPYTDRVAMVTAKTTIHEIGHSFEAGEADDRSFVDDPVRKFIRNGEVYSGRPDDPTRELVDGADEWSVMASGWDGELLIQPMEGRYYAYSIEELLTVKE